MIDLRSDTMTRPTEGMRAAMASAAVGDDVWGEDPTAKQLELRVAELLGKEAALFVPSGSMANQIALLAHTRRGDEVVGAHGSHCVAYEGGAPAALSGVHFREIGGDDGLFSESELLAAIQPDDIHFAQTSCVWFEQSHNRSGGRIWPIARLERVALSAKRRGLKSHIDGARLLNAAVALDLAPATIVSHVDSASICLSKGLGAPVGSVLSGTADFIKLARRLRKRLGGAMRQVGILAAGGLYALDHHVQGLAQDHDNARLIATKLANVDGLHVDLDATQTNIVIVSFQGAANAARVTATCADQDVFLCPMGPRRIRIVTHRDVTSAQAQTAADIIAQAAA